MCAGVYPHKEVCVCVCVCARSIFRRLVVCVDRVVGAATLVHIMPNA